MTGHNHSHAMANTTTAMPHHHHHTSSGMAATSPMSHAMHTVQSVMSSMVSTMMNMSHTHSPHGAHTAATVVADGGHMTSAHGGHAGHMSSTSGMNHAHMTGAGAAAGGSGHDGHDLGMGAGGGHGSGHNMYFEFTTNSIILFQGWETTNVGTLIGSMIGIFVFAFFFEGIRTLRDILAHRATQRALQQARESKVQKAVVYSWPIRDRILQSLMHMLFFTWSYALMLIFMTFNVWLCLAVILGVGAGYVTFLGWRPQFQQGPGSVEYRPSQDECCV